MKKQNLVFRVLIVVSFWAPFMGALIFLPAWTFNFWQGWLYLGTFFIPMFFVMIYMLRHERKLLEKRLHVKEKREPQSIIQIFNTFLFLALLIIAGLDHRFGWSNVPVWLVIVSAFIMLIGYMSFIGTMIHNAYASRVIEIQKGQKVVDTGPYAIVRHPMYVTGIVLYIPMPLVLGSFWALIPMLFIPFMLVLRILDEEKVLISDLKGYRAYVKKVKYRLIPFVW